MNKKSINEKSKIIEDICENYNVFYGLFTEDLYNTLLKFHNTVINGERFDRVVCDISLKKCMKVEEVVRALEDELSEKCGFFLHFRIVEHYVLSIFSNNRTHSRFIIVEEFYKK